MHMVQTITLPKTVIENLLNRINRLESAVFGEKKGQFPSEYVKLSPKAKSRYKKMEEDFKKGRNVYRFDNSEDALKFLLSDKR